MKLSRRVLLLSLTLLMVGVVIAVASRGGNSPARVAIADDSPEACVTRLLSAEELGAPQLYLDCFTAAERKKLETRWQGQSPSQIGAELRSQFAGLVGRVVNDLQLAGPDHATLVLERIREDHHQRQNISLVREGGQWQIDQLSAPTWQQPLIPYGTPLSEAE